MKKSKSPINVILTIFDKRFAFSFIMMLAIWLLPSHNDVNYSFLHLLPESIVIFVLGENMKKVVNSLLLFVIPILSVLTIFIIPQFLFYSSTLPMFIVLIFAILFVGGYISSKGSLES